MNHFHALIQRFRFNDKALAATVEGFTEDDWRRRASPDSSHAFWLLGHIALTRRILFRKLGGDMTTAPWESAFAKGSKALDGDFVVSPEILRADFAESGRRLEARLSALTAEDAAAPYGRTFPDGSSTIEGAAHFLYWHESYHLGQIGLLRRVCGKPGLA